MRLMGLQAIHPRRKTSLTQKEHNRYPYLLRGLEVRYPNQVWCADITYVPMQYGFMYLVVILDWFSRYVLAWQLSNTLDGQFCLGALQQALLLGTPEIPTRELNLPRWRLPVVSKRLACASAWTAAVGCSTTSSSSDFGVPSSMRPST